MRLIGGIILLINYTVPNVKAQITFSQLNNIFKTIRLK